MSRSIKWILSQATREQKEKALHVFHFWKKEYDWHPIDDEMFGALWEDVGGLSGPFPQELLHSAQVYGQVHGKRK